ncbi:serine/threonine-protein kinase, partial [Streptomyces sp. 150FB]|uniref:serine/threonine-protein kinase n=1 Tax=Streptomyces sp. 150FB TaxID=1576605 RepID=UPI0015681805
MGTVWQAEDELLHRLVAVKELHGVREGHGVGGQPGAADVASLREARAVARVKHPHVVVVHDVVEEDGAPYIVMELVEGPSLAERLKAGGPFDVPEAARIGLALLGALRAAHGFGVLHRDLKPANVLMEESTGRVVLTDFGIARLVEATSRTEAGSFVGSPEYTAPERMMGGDQAGPASDLWSLGALLCATLSGRSPFHRDSLAGVLHAVVEDEIRPPAAAEPLLPVVRGLLERDPARRLEAAEAERLLRAYLTDGAVPEDERPEPVAEVVPVAVPAAREPVPALEPERTPEHAPTPQTVPAPARRVHRARRVALVVGAALVVIAAATLGLAELGGIGIGSGTGAGENTGPDTAAGGRPV